MRQYVVEAVLAQGVVKREVVYAADIKDAIRWTSLDLDTASRVTARLIH